MIENPKVDWRKFEIVVMCGLPGSGKSYWAKRLAKEMGAEVVSSDRLRQEMFGTVRLDLAGDKVVMKQRREAYIKLYESASEKVKEGIKVVIDATNLKGERKEGIEKLKQVTDKIVMVVVKASKTSMRKRMKSKRGLANEKETYLQAWRRVIGYFEKHLEVGEYSWPSEKELGIKVIEIDNNWSEK